jgi:hypothetical protein
LFDLERLSDRCCDQMNLIDQRFDWSGLCLVAAGHCRFYSSWFSKDQEQRKADS